MATLPTTTGSMVHPGVSSLLTISSRSGFSEVHTPSMADVFPEAPTLRLEISTHSWWLDCILLLTPPPPTHTQTPTFPIILQLVDGPTILW